MAVLRLIWAMASSFSLSAPFIRPPHSVRLQVPGRFLSHDALSRGFFASWTDPSGSTVILAGIYQRPEAGNAVPHTAGMRAASICVRFVSAGECMRRASIQWLGEPGMTTAAAQQSIRLSPWCIDNDTRDNVIARRNVLAGLWAGRLLGLSNAELTAYAVEVHMSDFETEGDADIVLKVTNDLSVGGAARSEKQVRDKLRGFHLEAFRQAGATD
jgi:hypothetical protein